MIRYNKNDANRCQPEGDYVATLMSVEEETSKNTGKQMYKCQWKVYGKTFESQIIDRIVMPDFTWKLKKLAKAFGAEDKFDADAFDPAAYCNCNVTITLSVKDSEEFGEQNNVKGFKPRTGSAPAPTASEPRPTPRPAMQHSMSNHEAVKDEDIPFMP